MERAEKAGIKTIKVNGQSEFKKASYVEVLSKVRLQNPDRYDELTEEFSDNKIYPEQYCKTICEMIEMYQVSELYKDTENLIFQVRKMQGVTA
jgi:hypothetical protein